MSSYYTKEIELSNLILNTENPRFEISGSQREAVLTMIENQKEKLTKLATDIIEYGTNPSDVFMVMPSEDIGKFIVLEGNRRFVTLKLLISPHLIPETQKSLYIKFKDLSDEFYKNQINKISCVVFTDESEVNHWMKLKHTGQNNGIGVVGWDTQQSHRFDERVSGKTSYALQMIEYLKKEKSLDSNYQKRLSSMSLTNLQRLLSDPEIRSLLGLSVKEGQIYAHLEKEEILKGLSKILKDLFNTKFSVKDIYLKNDRLNYIETFKRTEIPDRTKSTHKEWNINKLEEYKTLKKDEDTQLKEVKKRKKIYTMKRSTIIPKSCILHIDEPRINKIYRELKDLDLNYFCNAGAITFRVFIELSVDHFIKIQKLTTAKFNRDSKRSKKVTKVCDYLEANKHAMPHETKAIRTSLSNTNSIFSINTFNAYIHNQHFNPILKDLTTSWDNYQLFFEKLWELV